VTEQLDLHDAVALPFGGRSQGPDEKPAVSGPAQSNGIERGTFGGEADVFGRVGVVLIEVAALVLDCPSP